MYKFEKPVIPDDLEISLKFDIYKALENFTPDSDLISTILKDLSADHSKFYWNKFIYAYELLRKSSK
jgi:hypothetical protein